MDDVRIEHKNGVFKAIAKKYGKGIRSFRDFVQAIERDSECPPYTKHQNTYKTILGKFIKIFVRVVDLEVGTLKRKTFDGEHVPLEGRAKKKPGWYYK
jgi:hypothetical protein